MIEQTSWGTMSATVTNVYRFQCKLIQCGCANIVIPCADTGPLCSLGN